MYNYQIIMKYQKQYEQLKNKITNSKSIAIFWHDYIDGDCIWSMLWFGSLLTNMQKNVSYFTWHKPAKKFDRIPNINFIKTDFDYREYDMIIRVDFNSTDRISKFDSSYFESKNIYILDHHPSTQILWITNIIDTDKSSACEIIWNFIDYIYSDLITPEISTYLLLWMMTDTGNFEYEKNSEEIFGIATNMIKKWANKKFIVNNLLPKYDQSYFDFLKIFVNRITKKEKIVYAYILLSDLQNFEIENIDDIPNFRNFIMNYEWVDLSIYITQLNKDKLKFSMRSKSWIAWPIAEYFWWWWHPNAWSFKIKQNQDILSEINNKISEINNLPIILW